ncbi:MAG: 23S rRNA (guanosine(2251)-2'-O)-methyltransferase RlmB [Clostridiales Family XIII bacterium]|jgi:23S rRNA (guanosine2251-2'-O)-methyltransferase|nr:23S rRNA (guanosine(2251)-2'-O)-methyltransferase RlmB [Clostridiales Family XIII bacterium]
MDKIIGRNPVLEALRAGRGFDRLLVQKGAAGSVEKIVDMARRSGVAIRFEEKSALDREAGGGAHQGVLAFVSDYRYASLDDMFARALAEGEPPLFVALDGIEDPRNLGAIIRASEAVGAHGVILPKRRAASVNDTVAKTSAGAAEHMAVARVSNMARTLLRLRDAGIWIAALDPRGENCFERDMTGPLALTVGGEGGGIGRLVRESCDFAVSLPMYGKTASLNAATAAAVALYEIRRQRSAASGRRSPDADAGVLR